MEMTGVDCVTIPVVLAFVVWVGLVLELCKKTRGVGILELRDDVHVVCELLLVDLVAGGDKLENVEVGVVRVDVLVEVLTVAGVLDTLESAAELMLLDCFI